MNVLLNVALTLGQIVVILVAVFYIVVFAWLGCLLCSAAWSSLRYRLTVRRMHAQIVAHLAPV